MSKALEGLRRAFPQISHEAVVGELSGRWIETQGNRTRNQAGSVVFTDRAAYVFKKRTLLHSPDTARVPLGSVQIEIKSDAPVEHGTATLYLDVVPDPENRTRWREAVRADDFATIRQVRAAGHRLAILEKQSGPLRHLVNRAMNRWEDDHQWRESGYESRIAMDRALNAAGSPIRLEPAEDQRVVSWIQQEGVSLQEAQSRILDEREGVTSTDSGAAPEQVADSDTEPKVVGAEPDHPIPTDEDMRVGNSQPVGEDVALVEPPAPWAGHWPERDGRGFPQLTVGAWLWAPGLDDWEGAVLTATVRPADSPKQKEELHLVIDLEDSSESVLPRAAWMYERIDLESDQQIYELRARGSFGVSDDDLYHCLVSSQSPWLAELCRYLEGSWEMRGQNPKGPAEFDELPALKWVEPDESNPVMRQEDTIAEGSLRPHDDRWCSVREANILLGRDRVCPGCGSVIAI